MPFHLMRVDAYEGRIKRLVFQQDRNALTLDQIKFSFETSPSFRLLQDDKAPLQKVFKHQLMLHPKQTHKISLLRCLLLGLVLCAGNCKLKARVFYDCLQDGNQQHIAASDNDFLIVFTALVEICCYMIPRLFCDIGEGSEPQFCKFLPEMRSDEFNTRLK